MPVYKADAVTQSLIDAGVLPQSTRRVLIDATVGEPLIVHYECFGRDEHVAALSAENVASAKPLEVPSIADALAPGRLDLHYLTRTVNELGRKIEQIEYVLSLALDGQFKDA